MNTRVACAPNPIKRAIGKTYNCIGQEVQVGSEWKLRKLDGRTREVIYEGDWFKNLITDFGLNQIGSGAVIGSWVRIGTGTTTPANTDVQLVSQSAATNIQVGGSTVINNSGAPDYQTNWSVTFEFALGAVVGNMAELGLGTASTGANLFSRARIVDSGGSPTTITVLASEILQVTYRISSYPALTDSSGTVDISGVTYNYTSRAYNVGGIRNINLGSWTGSLISSTAFDATALAALTASSPSGTQTVLTVGSFQAYTNGNYYRDFTVTAAIAVGNLTGGIDLITTNTGGSSAIFVTQTLFSPAIPKDNTKTLSLTFRISWSRRP